MTHSVNSAEANHSANKHQQNSYTRYPNNRRGRRPRRPVLHKQIFFNVKFFVPVRGVEDVAPYKWTGCVGRGALDVAPYKWTVYVGRGALDVAPYSYAVSHNKPRDCFDAAPFSYPCSFSLSSLCLFAASIQRMAPVTRMMATAIPVQILTAASMFCMNST